MTLGADREENILRQREGLRSKSEWAIGRTEPGEQGKGAPVLSQRVVLFSLHSLYLLISVALWREDRLSQPHLGDIVCRYLYWKPIGQEVE